MTGIALEKDMNRPFAVSLANGLPEEIRREDVAALREEWYATQRKYAELVEIVLDQALAEIEAIKAEIKTRLAQAQEAGFDTKGW